MHKLRNSESQMSQTFIVDENLHNIPLQFLIISHAKDFKSYNMKLNLKCVTSESQLIKLI